MDRPDMAHILYPESTAVRIGVVVGMFAMYALLMLAFPALLCPVCTIVAAVVLVLAVGYFSGPVAGFLAPLPIVLLHLTLFEALGTESVFSLRGRCALYVAAAAVGGAMGGVSVTARRLADTRAELARSEERLRTILEHARDRVRSSIQIVSSLLRLQASRFDDGLGLPVGFDPKATRTLGLVLVRSLAEIDLRGSVELDREAGTRWIIRFPRTLPAPD